MKLSEIGAKNDLTGWYSSSPINMKVYEMWRNLLKRCNCNETRKDFKYYKDCKVHEDFLLLSNFVKWIEQEPRYTEFCNTCDYITWSIDKDGIIPGNKEYAPGKIQLVTKYENNLERLARKGNPHPPNKEIIGIKNLNIISYQGVKDAIKDGFKGVCHVLKGKHKTCKGYKWYYLLDFQDISIPEGFNM